MCYYEGVEIKSDVARIINKFDIYICDLGEISPEKGNSLAKTRPCVIVQSDELNIPITNQYLIAPMRSESNVEVTDENLQNFLDTRKNSGRVYVPVKYAENDYSFIDITQIRQIDVTKIIKYVGTVINTETRRKINASIMEVFFSRDEFASSDTIKRRNYIPDTIEQTPIKEIESNEIIIEKVADTKPKAKSKKHTGGKPEKKLPNGFSLHYKMLKLGRTTYKELADKCGMSVCTLRKKVKEFEADHPDLLVSK